MGSRQYANASAQQAKTLIFHEAGEPKDVLQWDISSHPSY